jgi:PAS domain S-box-containing protein
MARAAWPHPIGPVGARRDPEGNTLLTMAFTRPTVVVIDDAPEVRALVRTRLRLSGQLDVVADGSDGTEAIALAHRHQPDLLLLDMSMPAMDGLDALTGVLAVSPGTRVVVFTGFEADGLSDLAREMGAAGFFQKSDDLDTLADRLLAVAQGDFPGTRPAVAGPPQAVVEEPTRDRAVLDEHLERFREVFDEAAIGMATLTLTGSIVRANRAFGALVQYPYDELVGLDYAALMAGRGDLLDDALEQITKDAPDTLQVEHLVSGAAGRRRVLATLAPVRDSAGQALYVFLQLRDITEQRAAEDELRSSEERFRLLVEAVEDYAIFMLSPEGIVSSWNVGAQRSKGYRADEIIGQHFRVFYGPELQQSGHPERELEMALRDGQYSEEGPRVRKDGTEFWASVLITALFDAAGNHVGFSKVTRDITPARASEESLRQSEQRFRLLVDAVRDYAIFMLDPTGHVMSWNAGAQRTKGYRADEIIGQHFRVFYPPQLQESRHPEQELEIALRDGRYSEEGWRVRKDGTTFWAHVVITAVFNEVGDHLGFSKVTRDTTAQRLAQQERDQAASDQSQFLAVTAHELRTPVAVLGGTADILAKHWTALGETERQALLEGMTSSASRLQRLLSDLLTASKLDASALRLERATVSLSEVVTAAAQSVRHSRSDTPVTVVPHEDVLVLADASRLSQALDNLLENAVKHGTAPVCIEIGAAGGFGEIRVIDSGPGVHPDVQPRLFERFATGDQITGTGLGLFIVRELARAHGGDATYELATHERPAGAFLVTVPLA